jgi:hypothetical protein
VHVLLKYNPSHAREHRSVLLWLVPGITYWPCHSARWGISSPVTDIKDDRAQVQ